MAHTLLLYVRIISFIYVYLLSIVRVMMTMGGWCVCGVIEWPQCNSSRGFKLGGQQLHDLRQRFSSFSPTFPYSIHDISIKVMYYRRVLLLAVRC